MPHDAFRDLPPVSSFVRPETVLPSRPCIVEVHGAQRRSRPAAWPPRLGGVALTAASTVRPWCKAGARSPHMPNMLRTARGIVVRRIETASAQPSLSEAEPSRATRGAPKRSNRRSKEIRKFQKRVSPNCKFDRFEDLRSAKFLAREETKMVPSIIVRLHSVRNAISAS